MKISYRKCFNLGNYENEVISIEDDVLDENDFAEVFESMKNKVEDLHQMSLEIDVERKESEKKARQEEDERMRSENPCYGCERFGKCDIPLYNRVRCFKYEETSDLPF